MPIVRKIKQEFPKEVPAPVVQLPPAAPVVVQGVTPECVMDALKSMESVVRSNEQFIEALRRETKKAGTKVITATVERDSQGRMERIRMVVEQ